MNLPTVESPSSSRKIKGDEPVLTAFVTKDLIESIPSDSHQGLMFLCCAFRDWSESTARWDTGQYETRILFLEAYHLLNHYVTDNHLDEFVDVPILDEKATEVVKVTMFIYTEALGKIAPFVSELEEKERLEAAESKVAQMLGKRFCYRLSETDILRLNELIDELIEAVNQINGLSINYERRLFRRLQTLRDSLSETMLSLESFYILKSDASVLYLKHREAADLSVKRIEQILGFAWRSQINAEDLPSDSQFELPSDVPKNEALS